AELPPRDKLEPIARQVRQLIGAASPRISRQLIARDLATLGGLLFEPLRHRAGVRRLLIVPDGDLFLVPFSALPVPGGGEALVERAEVAVLPSAEALLAIRRSAAEAGAGARDPRRSAGEPGLEPLAVGPARGRGDPAARATRSEDRRVRPRGEPGELFPLAVPARPLPPFRDPCLVRRRSPAAVRPAACRTQRARRPAASL